MVNSVVGFEVTANDVKKMKTFYGQVFGWKYSKGLQKGVHKIGFGNKNMFGSILERGEFIPDYVSLYIEVADLKKSISKIQNSGGEVIRPPFKPDGKTELAIVADPEGHVLTLIGQRKK
jgi:predicted enzyme related to lactoylglutathione lyase